MNNRRIRLLSEDVYNYVFHMLDTEPEMDGNEAGRIASKLQRLFESELSEDLKREHLNRDMGKYYYNRIDDDNA